MGDGSNKYSRRYSVSQKNGAFIVVNRRKGNTKKNKKRQKTKGKKKKLTVD